MNYKIFFIVFVIFLITSCKAPFSDKVENDYIDLVVVENDSKDLTNEDRSNVPEFMYGGKRSANIIIDLGNEYCYKMYINDNAEIYSSNIYHIDDENIFTIDRKAGMPSVKKFRYSDRYIVGYSDVSTYLYDVKDPLLMDYYLIDSKKGEKLCETQTEEELAKKIDELDITGLTGWVSCEDLYNQYLEKSQGDLDVIMKNEI